MNRDDCLALVYDAVQRVNEMRSPEEQVKEEPDTVLVGSGSGLDSLALTTLILGLEDLLRERTGKEISLIGGADFDTLTERFRTPAAIAELINGRL